MGETSNAVEDRWLLRSVPDHLAPRYRAEGWWNDDRWAIWSRPAWTSGVARCSACCRRCVRGRARSPTSIGRPGSWPAPCATTAWARVPSWCSNSPTGSRRGSRSGRRRTSVRSWCRSCTSTARRRSTTSCGRSLRRWSSPPTRSGATTTSPRTPRCCRAAPTLDEVREHLAAAGLARQKWPEAIFAVADLPRTPSGKVQKFQLRQQLREGRLPEESAT